jgi:thiosulfate/3-mercaptopyruvate sulfurtransferase
MFKTFGHANASVLDGGLPRWEDEGGQIESGNPSTPPSAKYPTPQLEENVVKSE